MKNISDPINVQRNEMEKQIKNSIKTFFWLANMFEMSHISKFPNGNVIISVYKILPALLIFH